MVARITVGRGHNIRSFLMDHQHRLFLVHKMRAALNTVGVVASPRIRTTRQVAITIGAFENSFRLFTKFSFSTSLVSLTLPSFVIRLQQRSIFMRFRVSISRTTRRQQISRFFKRILGIPGRTTGMAIINFKLRVHTIFRLLRVTNRQIMFRITMATGARAKFNLAMMAIQLRIFPALNRSGRINRVAMRVRIAALSISGFITP